MMMRYQVPMYLQVIMSAYAQLEYETLDATKFSTRIMANPI
eukprot:SAG31_NODE_862_length_11416_cov_8.600336_14_plen_41_part_00